MITHVLEVIKPQVLLLLLQGPSSRPKPVGYQVPADFDASVLGEVDLTTTDAAETGLANAFWLRWMQLRREASLKHSPGHTCLQPLAALFIILL